MLPHHSSPVWGSTRPCRAPAPASASAPRLSFSQICLICVTLSVVVVETNMGQMLWNVPRKQKRFQLGPREGALTWVVSADAGRSSFHPQSGISWMAENLQPDFTADMIWTKIGSFVEVIQRCHEKQAHWFQPPSPAVFTLNLPVESKNITNVANETDADVDSQVFHPSNGKKTHPVFNELIIRLTNHFFMCVSSIFKDLG